MTPPELEERDDDHRAVAITKRAITALLGSVITPASIAAKSRELDGPSDRSRGISTFTLRNRTDCWSLVQRFRSHAGGRRRRRRGTVPAHIAIMTKAQLIDALIADRARSMRADVSLDALIYRVCSNGRSVDRSKLDELSEERAGLVANLIPGRVSSDLANKARLEGDRSVRLVASALAAMTDSPRFTQPDVIAKARELDEKGRGVHADIFERSAGCASLWRAAKGLPEPATGDRPKKLLRLNNHDLGLAVACERRYFKAVEKLGSKFADLAIDLELDAITTATFAAERQWLREQAELKRDLETLGLA